MVPHPPPPRYWDAEIKRISFSFEAGALKFEAYILCSRQPSSREYGVIPSKTERAARVTLFFDTRAQTAKRCSATSFDARAQLELVSIASRTSEGTLRVRGGKGEERDEEERCTHSCFHVKYISSDHTPHDFFLQKKKPKIKKRGDFKISIVYQI